MRLRWRREHLFYLPIVLSLWFYTQSQVVFLILAVGSIGFNIGVVRVLSKWGGLPMYKRGVYAVGSAILVYSVIASVPTLTDIAITVTLVPTKHGLDFLGFHPVIIETSATAPALQFNSGKISVITLDCAGIEVIAGFVGIVMFIEDSLLRRSLTFAGAVSCIYVANILRNIFVAIAHATGVFDTPFFAAIFSQYTSFNVAHTIIARPLAVLVILGLLYTFTKRHPTLYSDYRTIVSSLAKKTRIG